MDVELSTIDTTLLLAGALSLQSYFDRDNAMCESFFATLECELLNRSHFRTHDEARDAIFDFIEGFYNTHRRHSALGCHSPVQFERVQAAVV